MISQGVSPKVVAERLGHANVSITLGLYTHVLPAHDRATEAFAQALAMQAHMQALAAGAREHRRFP